MHIIRVEGQNMHSIPVGDSNQHMIENKTLNKIPAFDGQDSDNNKRILKTIAEKGPQIKYSVCREMIEGSADENVASQTRQLYPTVSRRIDDLVKRGYLKPVGEIPAGKGPMKSKVYGLTWKGVIPVILLDPSKNIIHMLKDHKLLDDDFYENLKLFEAVYTAGEIKKISTKFIIKFLELIPFNIENTKDNELAAYVIPTILLIDKIYIDELIKSREQLSRIPFIRERFLAFLDDYIEKTEKSLGEAKHYRELIKEEIKREKD